MTEAEILRVIGSIVSDPESYRLADGSFVIPILDDGSDDPSAYIKGLCPRHWIVEWTGNSNTEANGDTYSDLRIEPSGVL